MRRRSPLVSYFIFSWNKRIHFHGIFLRVFLLLSQMILKSWSWSCPWSVITQNIWNMRRKSQRGRERKTMIRITCTNLMMIRFSWKEETRNQEMKEDIVGLFQVDRILGHNDDGLWCSCSYSCLLLPWEEKLRFNCPSFRWRWESEWLLHGDSIDCCPPYPSMVISTSSASSVIIFSFQKEGPVI